MTPARVLLVEDCIPVRDRVRDLLTAHGHIESFEVGTLRDARSALRSSQFDAVLLDVGLPDGSGLDLLSELCVGEVRPISVVLTALAGTELGVRCIELGADHFFEKAEIESAVRVVSARLRHGWRPRVQSASGHPRPLEQAIERAIEQAEESIVVTDAAGYVEFVNPAFERSTGYRHEEVAGRNIIFLKTGYEGVEFHRRVLATLLLGETWRGRIKSRKKDGAILCEETTISPVRDASGVVVRYVGVMRDLTRDELLMEQIVRAQKMDSLGGLAASIAHDFNNVLGAILCNADAMREEVRPGSQAEQDLTEIRDLARHATELSRQLLGLVRDDPSAPRRLDLGAVLADKERVLRRLVGPTIELAIDRSPGPLPVRADAAQVAQVLINLVANAVDAMPKGGRLDLAARPVALDAPQAGRFGPVPAGAWAVLEVRDQGLGMSAEVSARLFEPLFTTKGPERGTGLGLATVAAIVRRSGGHVQVDSSPGRGSVFRVLFPRLDDARDSTESPRVGSGGPIA